MVQKHISIKEDTKQLLDGLGKFQESYDDIVKRLILKQNNCTCDSPRKDNPVLVGERLIEDHKKKEGWG